MPVSTQINLNDIINRVAVEVGIPPIADPSGSQDPAYIKLRYLLNTAGEELMMSYAWEQLTRSHQIVTQVGDSGVYDLPDDFGYMINQTGWERAQNVPLGGPLSAQDWTYLKGRDLAQNTLYASFRIAEGQLHVFPDPPPVGLDINFEYISSHWVKDVTVSPVAYKGEASLATDIPLFDKTLITRAVKVKYLEAAGFDSSKAQADYNYIFGVLTGNAKGAPVLSAGRNRNGYPYLSVYNVPDTGFGS